MSKRISVRAILFNQLGGIVLIERHKHGDHYHVFPGGGVEDGEGMVEALFRELKEEVGSVIRLINDQPILSYEDEKTLQHFFVAQEIERGNPTGQEHSSWASPDNQYSIVSVNINEMPRLDIRPSAVSKELRELAQKYVP